jgi:hypothetical protein
MMATIRPKVMMRGGFWGVVWQYGDGSTTQLSWAYESLPDAYTAAYIASSVIMVIFDGRDFK